jgi:chromosomal replication initiation ATPase DnaA
MVMNALKDPQFVIGNQTFKIIRLENEIKDRDKRILSLVEEKEALTRKVNSLQKELILSKKEPAIEKKSTPIDYRKAPQKIRRYIVAPIDEQVIKEVVCKEFETTMEELASKDRKIAFKRQWMMYMLYNHTMLSYEEIGAMFNRDHTTVIHSSKTIQYDIDVNDKAVILYQTIKDKCLSEANRAKSSPSN